MEVDSRALESARQEMFLWRGRFFGLALPLWLALTWFGLTRSPMLVLLAQLTLLAGAVPVWRALYRYARAAGSARYARGQVLLAIFLTPFLFVGVWAVPLLVASDVDKDVARLRAETAPPLWFAALDTLVVCALLGLGVALVGSLGVVGLFLAALAVPLLYKGFRVVTQAVRP